jgi:diguanylate cyclase (GGDEF)-like protein
MPRRACYAIYGAGLALGAPLGLFVLRSLQYGTFGLGSARAELARDAWLYAYVSISTMLVFSAFGFVLGRQADRLHDIASVDALTGLKNRRILAERLDEEFLRARRYGGALSVLLIDLDGLKAVNDEHGHRAGDLALCRAAGAIRSGSRASDVAGRWGGDEFVLLAPDTRVEEAWHLAERIRGFVAAAAGYPHITVSVGVASAGATAPVADAEDLVRAADAALYEAKRLGRNCIVVARQDA